MAKNYASTVYEWERQYVAPLDSQVVAREHLQPIVDYMWADLGLQHPPKVNPLNKQAHCWARANRMTIDVPEQGIPTWVLIHELAHSLTSNFEGNNHSHNSRYVGVYLSLILKYLPGADAAVLMQGLLEYGVHVSHEGHCIG